MKHFFLRRGCTIRYLFFSAPYPSAPLPGGEGALGFLMQGASPLASLRLCRKVVCHTEELATSGGRRFCGFGRLFHVKQFLQAGQGSVSREALLLAVRLYHSLLDFPAPPCPPSPAGKGALGFLCKGLRPLHPCASVGSNAETGRFLRPAREKTVSNAEVSPNPLSLAALLPLRGKGGKSSYRGRSSRRNRGTSPFRYGKLPDKPIPPDEPPVQHCKPRGMQHRTDADLGSQGAKPLA